MQTEWDKTSTTSVTYDLKAVGFGLVGTALLILFLVSCTECKGKPQLVVGYINSMFQCKALAHC